MGKGDDSGMSNTSKWIITLLILTFCCCCVFAAVGIGAGIILSSGSSNDADSESDGGREETCTQSASKFEKLDLTGKSGDANPDYKNRTQPTSYAFDGYRHTCVHTESHATVPLCYFRIDLGKQYVVAQLRLLDIPELGTIDLPDPGTIESPDGEIDSPDGEIDSPDGEIDSPDLGTTDERDKLNVAKVHLQVRVGNYKDTESFEFNQNGLCAEGFVAPHYDFTFECVDWLIGNYLIVQRISSCQGTQCDTSLKLDVCEVEVSGALFQ